MDVPRSAARSPNEEDKLLRTFSGDVEAAWACRTLEADGIPCRVDAMSAQYGTGTPFKSRLFVTASMAPEAEAILASIEADPPAEPEPDSDRERSEYDSRRRLRFVRFGLGTTALSHALVAIVTTALVGGAESAVAILLAAVWIAVFVGSFTVPRLALAAATVLAAIMLMLSALGALAGPEFREPPSHFFGNIVLILATYWAWQAERATNRDSARSLRGPADRPVLP